MEFHQGTNNKEQIKSKHHIHMDHGLVGTNKTRMNVEIVSASVKQHYHSMFASMEQRHMLFKN